MCSFFLSPAAQSTSISNIIDDTNGDPTGIAQIAYSPEGWWTAGLTCKGCTSHPDPALTYEDGWRDASQFGSPGGPAVTATITFSGSAISVYGVLDQAQVVPTDLTFILDGQTGCPFLFQTADATAQPEYLYNVLMFSADSLAAGPHTLVIQVGDAETSRHSVILLDYITYM
ncbi:hypothetical protein C8J56DRAFT_804405 [Mycena floridula]|nr:hypothetical protein C8J56DRAFT_804405 [Mycena floridula]